MRKIFHKFSSFQLVFIIFFGVFFSFLIILSIPSLFDYSKFIKKIETQVESDFGIRISKISNIKYRFVPSPHLVLERFNLSFDEKKDSLIASPENSKIYVPFFNLYKRNNLTVNKIILKNVNFNFNKETFNLFINHLMQNQNKEVIIKKSKFFYTNYKNQVSTIAVLKDLSYFSNNKSKQKKLKILGNLFDTNFNFNWSMDLNNKHLTNFELKFKKPNLNFENKLNSSAKNKKIGSLRTTFLNYKIDTDYSYNNKLIKFIPEKTNNQIASIGGVIELKPFSLDLDININEQNINSIINSILYNYYFNKENIHKNLNGTIRLNFEDIKNAYFKSGYIEFEMSDTKINILNNSLNIRNIGSIKMLKSFFFEQKGEIFFTSLIELNVSNQDELFRRFSIPIKNRKKIEKIFLIFEKNIDKNIYSISELSFNKPTEFEFKLKNFNLLDRKTFDNFQKFRKIIKEEFVLKN